MAFPVVITTFQDQPNAPAPITDDSAQATWWTPSSSKIHVHNGNWYALWITHPQPGAGGSGQYYARAWKSADQGQTWSVLDLANSQKVNPFASPQNISVVRSGTVLYVLYQYGVDGGSAADYELRIGSFDMASETWGAAITGGPINACQPDNTGGHAHDQDYGGVKLCMILDPAGTGFVIQYLSQGDLNPNVHFGPDFTYICSYITCSFGGAWGAQLDFDVPLPQSETIPGDPTTYYGSTPQGLVAAPSGRIHFFFSSLRSNLGAQNSYRIFECSLLAGVLSGYTLVADDVFPLNFGSGGSQPGTGDSITPVGYPVSNGTELLIPYIGVFDDTQPTPFDPQANTKVRVARAASASGPVWTWQDVTTAANQGPSPAGGATSATGGSAIEVDPNTPCIDIAGGAMMIGWARSVYTGGFPFAATNAAVLYYAQSSGSGWSAPVAAFTTPENMALQWCRFFLVDATTVGWAYFPQRDGESEFAPPYFQFELFSAAVSNPPSADCNNPGPGIVGQPYSHTFLASGGTPPYLFSIFAGSIPPGLSLNPTTGKISGTPTAAGTYTFTVEVQNG